MASVKFTTIPPKILSQSILSTATTFKLNSITGWDGAALTSADFGTQAFGAFLNPTRTVMEIFEFDPTTIASTSISFIGRGLPFTGGQTPVTANKLDWTANETTVLIGTDVPQLLEMLVDLSSDQTIGGVKTFSSSPVVPTGGTGTQAANNDDIANAITGFTGKATNLVAGTTKISTPAASPTNPIAVGDNDYRLNPNNYAADAGSNDTYVITLSNVPASYVTGQKFVFKANTANTGTATLNVNSLGAKTIVRSDGTTLLTGDILANQIVEVIYNGTNMVMTSAPAGTVNLVSGAYPAGDGINITGVALKRESYTASGNITQNDTVYVSAANTVKSLYPSAQGTGASVSTAPSTFATPTLLPLSTNGNVLLISGGDKNTSSGLKAQVRTINAGETDFSNGSQENVYITGNGVRSYDVKSIGTDKFLIIFQADTGGSAAGIKTVVITVSGTTITVGSVVGIETTGNLTLMSSVAKVDTDKAIIFYPKDSDSKMYCQVLTVSGTTITTNTPVVVDNTRTNPNTIKSDQLATGSVAVVANFNSAETIYGNTISVSGTTPTVNAQQTILTIGGSSGWNLGLRAISSTKLLFIYGESGSPTTDKCAHIAVSGATMTMSSTISLSSANITEKFPMVFIGTTYALIADFNGNTSYKVFFLNVSGTAPVSISNQVLGQSTSSGLYLGIGLAKISPWTYYSIGSQIADSDYIIKLTPASPARLGLAESDIVDTASGYILNRYIPQTVSNITLVPGSFYYTDDTGQPTLNSSLTAPTIGMAISTNKILLQ